MRVRSGGSAAPLGTHLRERPTRRPVRIVGAVQLDLRVDAHVREPADGDPGLGPERDREILERRPAP
jgi:hypothetical protein